MPRASAPFAYAGLCGLVLVGACGRPDAGRSQDTLAISEAMDGAPVTADTGAPRPATPSVPSPAAPRDSSGAPAAAGGRKSPAGGLASGDLAVVAGAAQQGAGGLQVMPWENLVPLVITDMRAHVQRQERNLARDGRYSSSAPPLGVAARDGWTTRIVYAGPRGWSAVATQAFYPGRSCVIWVGASAEEARAPRTESAGLRGAEGEPVCDPTPTR